MPEKTKTRMLLADAVIVLLSYGAFYREGFAADTLFQRMIPMSNIGGDLDQGRYAIYLLARVLTESGFLITEHYRFFSFLFLAAVTAGLYMIQLIFLPFFRERPDNGPALFAGFVSGSSLLLVNVLFTECFMFPEYYMNYSIAFSLAIGGALCVSRGKPLPGALLIAASCLFYQTAILPAAMLITAAFVMQAEFRLDRRLILRVFGWNAGILFAGFLDMLSTGWIARLGIIDPEDAGKPMSADPADTLRYLAEETGSLLKDALGLLPGLWLPCLAVLAAAGTLVYILLRKKDLQTMAVCGLLLLEELVLCYLFPFLAGRGGFFPQTVFLFCMIPAVLFLTAFLYVPHRPRRVLAVLCGGFLLLQVLFIQFIAADRTLSNRLDLTYAGAVQERIEAYEAETGITVQAVATINDLNAPNYYDCVRFHRDQINERVLAVSPYVLLEYVNGPGIRLKHVEMDPAIQAEHFAGRDWDSFLPEEQLFFAGDTLYWVIF